MTLCRVAPLAAAVLLGCVAEAAAQAQVQWPDPPRPGQAPIQQAPPQFPGQAPASFPGQAPASFPGQAPPQGQGGPPCMADFVPLRKEAENRAAAIKTAADRKADRGELCNLFKRFAEAEAKVVKFVTTNQAQCGIPPQAVGQVKGNHGKTVQMRDRVCSGGPAQAEGKPRGPGLGEALGARPVVSPDATGSGKGIFDTMTGNPLTR